MATDSREIADQPTDSEEITNTVVGWYDRSSLLGDFVVMIADQTEEDYRRRYPDKHACDYINGMIYLYPSDRDRAYEENVRKTAEAHKIGELTGEVDAEDSMKNWYDRSSLVGDFMVMIADQTFDD